MLDPHRARLTFSMLFEASPFAVRLLSRHQQTQTKIIVKRLWEIVQAKKKEEKTLKEPLLEFVIGDGDNHLFGKGKINKQEKAAGHGTRRG